MSRIPAILDPPPPAAVNRHQIAKGYQIEATPVLGGLRHRYRQKKVAWPESTPIAVALSRARKARCLCKATFIGQQAPRMRRMP